MINSILGDSNETKPRDKTFWGCVNHSNGNLTGLHIFLVDEMLENKKQLTVHAYWLHPCVCWSSNSMNHNRDTGQWWELTQIFFFLCHKICVNARFGVETWQPPHALFIQIIISRIRAEKTQIYGSGHENEKYQRNTHIHVVHSYGIQVLASNFAFEILNLQSKT